MRKIILGTLILAGCSTSQPDHFDWSVQPDIVKRAVVVGMKNSKLAGPCPGADVDADVAKIMMRESGFSVVTLDDSQCTRESALHALQSAINGAKPGSLLVLFWSGHGGQTRDLNGDEVDGLDEYLCPWDVPLLDDELAATLDTVPAGVRVFAIFDICNSGTMARKALQAPRIVNPRTFKASLIVFAGCADGKYSHGDKSGGKWTTALVDAWSKGQSYRAWFNAAVARMDQSEQLPKWTQYGDCSAFANSPALQ